MNIIFIVGNSRSGTTMMGRILGNNPDIFTFGELHFFGKLYEPSKKNIKSLNIEQSVNLFAKLLCVQREGYFAPCTDNKKYLKEISSNINNIMLTPEAIYIDFLKYETKIKKKNIACEQTPRNLYYIENILKLPCNVKIINMVRDPRDVLLSQKTKWKRKFLGANKIPLRESIRSWINYHPITIAWLWKSAINKSSIYHNHTSIISVKFEDLLEQPKNTMQRVTQFLDISYTNDMLRIPHTGSSEIHDTSEIGINKKRLNPWKKSDKLKKTEIYLCEKICSNQMNKLGYILSEVKPSLILLIYLLFSFLLKIIFSFIFNINRSKNILLTIKKRLAI